MRNRGQITLGYSPVIETDKKPFKSPLRFDNKTETDQVDDIAKLNDRLKRMKIMVFRTNSQSRSNFNIVTNEDNT